LSLDDGSLLTFPCDVPIKVFGRNDIAFRAAAAAVARAHYHDAHTITEQVSRNGNYLSLTITVKAQSRAELDAVYHALVASDDILMVL
jgi:hypothetical protein